MSLRDLEIKSEYRTKLVDIAREFLVPVLSEAVVYKRAVGFFSSSSLMEVAKGVSQIATKGGIIKLIASPSLSPEDIDAISRGYEAREEILKSSVLKALPEYESLSSLEQDRYNLLAHLIADGILDIKIAFAESKSGYGIYHEKVAIVEDAEGNKVAFSGSMNSSENAMRENYETVDVFRSWNDPEKRAEIKSHAFDAIWGGYEQGVTTFDFPEVKETIVKRYCRKKPDYNSDLLGPEQLFDNEDSLDIQSIQSNNFPRIPDAYKLRGYQTEAIEEWSNNGYRGIYDMATGAGKTVTALASICNLAQHLNNKLAVVIVCPYQHLVEQWVEDIKLFNIDPIVGYSASSQRDWYDRLDDVIRNQKYGVSGSEFFCFICTNGTYATARVQKMISKIKENKLLVVDEAHNFGAEYLSTLLREDFDYRLALSATIERYGDEDGTSSLFNYFGDRCIEYTLEEAIFGRGEEPPCLTPYRYYPIIVYLEDDEREEYSRLSRSISQETRQRSNGSKYLTERGKMLILSRARLVAAAHQKIPALKEAIQPYVDDSFILVYCGATKVEIDSGEIEGIDDYEVRQIDAVTHLLGSDLKMRVRQFTSRENSSEREEIKEMYSKEDLQALIAIKCLDEGVNIPLIKTAFILASTTNPREYIQRRGRLLRKDKNGLKERAEIFDFITLPRPADNAAVLPDEEIRGEQRLVYNEIVRAKEFASLAENASRVNKLIYEIEEAFFGVNGIEGYQNQEVE